MMRQKAILLAIFLCVTLISFSQDVVVLEVDAPIFAATAEYVENGIAEAVEKGAVFIVLRINTPGGLLDATRRIVGEIMDSPIPVISYVGPFGAHAGSAGAFIALSANVCAMSPGTNIGASHPVSAIGAIDSIMNEKITEDAAAFIRSIAEKRGRDTTLLMQMVTNSRSFSAEQALRTGIIDYIVDNVDDLLAQMNNSTVVLNSGEEIVMHTTDLNVEYLEMGAKVRFLNKLNDPNVMYLLLLLGVMAIMFEVFNPGALIPGIVGAICLILAGYGMTLLPVDYTGLALIVLAIVLFILELKFQSYALLSIGGIIALFLGSIFLIRTEPSFDVVDISWSVLISSVIVTTVFFVFLLGIGLKALRGKTKTGSKGMVGRQGRSLTELTPRGKVRVMGEIWDAVSESGNIEAGTVVEIVSVEGLELTVKIISLTSE